MIIFSVAAIVPRGYTEGRRWVPWASVSFLLNQTIFFLKSATIVQSIPANLGFGEQVIHVVLERGDTSIMYELHITTTRDVPGSQIPRTRTALKVYRKQYLDTFKGKIK